MRRGYAMRMRAVDAAECYPFVGGCRSDVEGESPPRFRPMDPKPLSRWWKHELAAGQARLLAGAKGGEAAASGGGLRKGTKRKGSRSSSTGERARKRRHVLQFRSFLTKKVWLCFMGACALAWWTGRVLDL
uniref:Uncharacterized protein n=1 Tax=Zea mays TaxID=4577 RepID=A0A804UHP1_MAIZE